MSARILNFEGDFIRNWDSLSLKRKADFKNIVMTVKLLISEFQLYFLPPTLRDAAAPV